jgi:hypothetical protein
VLITQAPPPSPDRHKGFVAANEIFKDFSRFSFSHQGARGHFNDQVLPRFSRLIFPATVGASLGLEVFVEMKGVECIDSGGGP